MIILPTLYRSENLKRFVQCYNDTDASLPVWVIIDGSNMFHYNDAVLPKTFRKVYVSPGMRIGEIFNTIFKHSPKEDFYGIVADDVVPTTRRWDIVLREACLPNKIAWGFDGGHDETLPRHPFIGGDLARALGYLSVPGIKHWYADNAWRDIASGLNCGDYRPEVRMTHLHYTNGLAQQDRTYLEQPDPRSDEMTYRMWLEKEFPQIVEKLSKA